MNPVEEWRDIAPYEGLYQVSNRGRVKRLRGKGCRVERILSSRRGDAYGHLMVDLYSDGKPTHRKVHQLVAEAFIGPRPAGKVVDHRDSDPTNNRVENLRYISQRENTSTPHARQASRDAKLGYENSVVQQFKKTGELVAEYDSIREAAR